MSEQKTELKRSLSSRHLSMIALGGSIGTGIFVAMGGTLNTAGPGGSLLAYAITGIMIYFLMTSLGEMATYMPVPGSFSVYARKFIDPALGFALGWNYWYNWAITIAAELSAATLVIKYWFPHVPAVYWSILFLAIIFVLNVFSSRVFGESEFWFAGIKVAVVIIFLIVGVLMILGIFAGGRYAGLHNFTIGDGPFHGGLKATLAIFLVAGFSFQGTELLGVASGESKDSDKSIPKAVNTIFWRIIIFYLGTIFVVGAIIPFTQASVNTSPFTMIFQKAGVAVAASIMNAVVLTAVLSAGNSGMYASSRMLYSLAKEGNAPKIFAKLTKRGVPIFSLLLTTVVGMACFLSAVVSEDLVYKWLVAASGLAGFIAWIGIAGCHYRFRKAFVRQGYDLKKLKFRAKWFPVGPILALIMCVLVVVGQGYSAITPHGIKWSDFIAAYIGVPFFLIFYIAYKVKFKTKVVPLDQVDLTYVKDADQESEKTIN